eukprot:gene1931-2366_t
MLINNIQITVPEHIESFYKYIQDNIDDLHPSFSSPNKSTDKIQSLLLRYEKKHSLPSNLTHDHNYEWFIQVIKQSSSSLSSSVILKLAYLIYHVIHLQEENSHLPDAECTKCRDNRNSIVSDDPDSKRLYKSILYLVLSKPQFYELIVNSELPLPSTFLLDGIEKMTGILERFLEVIQYKIPKRINGNINGYVEFLFRFYSRCNNGEERKMVLLSTITPYFLKLLDKQTDKKQFQRVFHHISVNLYGLIMDEKKRRIELFQETAFINLVRTIFLELRLDIIEVSYLTPQLQENIQLIFGSRVGTNDMKDVLRDFFQRVSTEKNFHCLQDYHSCLWVDLFMFNPDYNFEPIFKPCLENFKKEETAFKVEKMVTAFFQNLLSSLSYKYDKIIDGVDLFQANNFKSFCQIFIETIGSVNFFSQMIQDTFRLFQLERYQIAHFSMLHIVFILGEQAIQHLGGTEQVVQSIDDKIWQPFIQYIESHQNTQLLEPFLKMVTIDFKKPVEKRFLHQLFEALLHLTEENQENYSHFRVNRPIVLEDIITALIQLREYPISNFDDLKGIINLLPFTSQSFIYNINNKTIETTQSNTSSSPITTTATTIPELGDFLIFYIIKSIFLEKDSMKKGQLELIIPNGNSIISLESQGIIPLSGLQLKHYIVEDNFANEQERMADLLKTLSDIISSNKDSLSEITITNRHTGSIFLDFFNPDNSLTIPAEQFTYSVIPSLIKYLFKSWNRGETENGNPIIFNFTDIIERAKASVIITSNLSARIHLQPGDQSWSYARKSLKIRYQCFGTTHSVIPLLNEMVSSYLLPLDSIKIITFEWDRYSELFENEFMEYATTDPYQYQYLNQGHDELFDSSDYSFGENDIPQQEYQEEQVQEEQEEQEEQKEVLPPPPRNSPRRKTTSSTPTSASSTSSSSSSTNNSTSTPQRKKSNNDRNNNSSSNNTADDNGPFVHPQLGVPWESSELSDFFHYVKKGRPDWKSLQRKFPNRNEEILENLYDFCRDLISESSSPENLFFFVKGIYVTAQKTASISTENKKRSRESSANTISSSSSNVYNNINNNLPPSSSSSNTMTSSNNNTTTSTSSPQKSFITGISSRGRKITFDEEKLNDSHPPPKSSSKPRRLFTDSPSKSSSHNIDNSSPPLNSSSSTTTTTTTTTPSKRRKSSQKEDSNINNNNNNSLILSPSKLQQPIQSIQGTPNAINSSNPLDAIIAASQSSSGNLPAKLRGKMLKQGKMSSPMSEEKFSFPSRTTIGGFKSTIIPSKDTQVTLQKRLLTFLTFSDSTQQPSSSPQQQVTGSPTGSTYRNQLSKSGKWATYEWFYSDLDVPFYFYNEFQIWLNQIGIGKRKKLTKMEWNEVRLKMKKPRRLSKNFFNEAREKLYQTRDKVRQSMLKDEIFKFLLIEGNSKVLYLSENSVHKGTVVKYSEETQTYAILSDTRAHQIVNIPDTFVMSVDKNVRSIVESNFYSAFSSAQNQQQNQQQTQQNQQQQQQQQQQLQQYQQQQQQKQQSQTPIYNGDINTPNQLQYFHSHQHIQQQILNHQIQQQQLLQQQLQQHQQQHYHLPSIQQSINSATNNGQFTPQKRRADQYLIHHNGNSTPSSGGYEHETGHILILVLGLIVVLERKDDLISHIANLNDIAETMVLDGYPPAFQVEYSKAILNLEYLNRILETLLEIFRKDLLKNVVHSNPTSPEHNGINGFDQNNINNSNEISSMDITTKNQDKQSNHLIAELLGIFRNQTEGYIQKIGNEDHSDFQSTDDGLKKLIIT